MIVVSLLIATVAIGLYGLWCKARLRHLEFASKFQGVFFQAAGDLIDNPETPPIVVEFVARAASMLGKRFIVWRMLSDYLNGNVRRFYRNPSAKLLEFREAVKHLNAPMKRDLGVVMVTMVLVVINRSPFFGWLLTRLSLYQVSETNGGYEGAEQAEGVFSTLARI